MKSDKTSKYKDLAKNKDQQINKYTTNNYYITNRRKKSQQIAPSDLGRIRSNTYSIRIPCINDGKPTVFELPRALKLISKHTLTILYGILGSIVATALTGAIYSIIDSESDREKMSATVFSTRTITGIATKITTEPNITNSLHSSIILPTTNLGTQRLLSRDVVSEYLDIRIHTSISKLFWLSIIRILKKLKYSSTYTSIHDIQVSIYPRIRIHKKLRHPTIHVSKHWIVG